MSNTHLYSKLKDYVNFDFFKKLSNHIKRLHNKNITSDVIHYKPNFSAEFFNYSHSSYSFCNTNEEEIIIDILSTPTGNPIIKINNSNYTLIKVNDDQLIQVKSPLNHYLNKNDIKQIKKARNNNDLESIINNINSKNKKRYTDTRINDIIIVEFDEKIGSRVVYGNSKYNLIKKRLSDLMDYESESVIKWGREYFHYFDLDINNINYRGGKNSYGIIIVTNGPVLPDEKINHIRDFYENVLENYSNSASRIINNSLEQSASNSMTFNINNEIINEFRNNAYELIN